jgi:hypothetical protein
MAARPGMESMSVLNPKSKTISFRLSQREFAAAISIAREQLFESLSEFARHAVLTFGESPAIREQANRLRHIEERMNVLMQKLSSLSQKGGEE